MKIICLTISLLSLTLSHSILATRIGQVGYLQYSDKAFANKDLDRNKSFAKIDLPMELQKDNKKSIYALLGGQYNFNKTNPFTNDDSFYLGGAGSFKFNEEDKMSFFAAYYYHGASDFSNLAHDLYLGVDTEIDVPLGFKMTRVALWLRHAAKNFQTPSPAIQFARQLSDKWSLKTSILVDFKMKMYSPFLPTKVEATYEANKDLRAGLGYNFDETIQSRPKQAEAYFQTGSRGLMYGFADYRISGNYWAGIQTGLGYEMLTSFNKEGDELNDDSNAGNRLIPFFINLNFSHIV